MNASTGYCPAQHQGRRMCRTNTANSRSWKVPGWHKIHGPALRNPCSVSLWSGERILVRVRFSAPVHTDPGAHPACCTLGNESINRGSSGQGVAEVKETVELYFYCSLGLHGLFWGERFFTKFIHTESYVYGTVHHLYS